MYCNYPVGAYRHAYPNILEHLKVQCLAETKYHLIYHSKYREGYYKQCNNLKVAVLTEYHMPEVSLGEN